MSRIRNAAIIGSHWGLVHLPPLQSLGIKVTALVSHDLQQAQAVAAEHQIPLVTDQATAIGQPDLVIVATPAVTHAEIIRAFPHSHIFCEKPVVGPYGNPAELPHWADRVLINYAFSQLDSSRCIMAQQLTPRHIKLHSRVNLSGFDFDARQWFFEVTSHPLSWLLHWLGEPTLDRRHLDNHHIQLQLQCGTTDIDIDFAVAGEAGIYHRFEINCEQGLVELAGCYQPGSPWRFEPVLHNQQALNQGEFISSDCWLRANQRSLELAIRHFNGELTMTEVERLGAFSVAKALAIEGLFES
ncbi:Gfo/Idh/MocA family oxidoreductase [Neiella sp. HB171785]|uniref:Gfo/Idh/MocA family oxidoreductase n=1 Tax=Neiella litorisoli TaxID=2771431 RepID=A0A8J6UPE0_9GAMM|nr:Gfo/Idh/MocA family oxidoreductase [Neiella litorisoli]MBD1388097.1 Gfo/Idh/MocA family oxidoreductase [Neiella litorisoli]